MVPEVCDSLCTPHVREDERPSGALSRWKDFASTTQFPNQVCRENKNRHQRCTGMLSLLPCDVADNHGKVLEAV